MFYYKHTMDLGGSQKFDCMIKIVVIGDSNVGKTNIVSKLVEDKFIAESKPTIGVEFGTKLFRFDDRNIKVQVWDTAGQERYHAITTSYYRGSAGVVLVYDITNKSSLENIRNIWLRNLNSVLERKIPKMLLGNKSDLTENRVLSTDAGKEFALSEGLGFFETSALSGDNILIAFESFVKKIYEEEKKRNFISESKTTAYLNTKGKTLRIKKTKKSACC